MEYFDVLTETGEKTGETKSRADVHRDGDWHASVHVWIINSKGELLLQRRSPQKDTGANKWDVSCGGHVQAGNTPIVEAQRECFEELGIQFTESELQHIFTVTQNYIRPTEINREYNDVYLVRKDIDLSTLVLQEEEVAEVKYMPWQEMRKCIEAEDPTFCTHEDEYIALFDYLARA